jgi:beta-lactamase class A
MHHTIVRQLAGVIAASIIAGANGAAVAADHPTKDEATAFVKKAIAHYKAVGRARAFSDISAPEGNKFVDGELYVAVTEISTGIAIANSTNQRFLGKVVIDMKDVDGKLYVKEQLDAGKAGKASWVDYRFPNPVTKQLGSKTTYCEPYDGFIFCTGIYR